MGAIHVHEFMSLDGVIDAPTWTFDYGFDPKMGETLGELTAGSKAILLGRNTEVIGPYDPARIQRLKDETDGNIYISGSATLVQALLADGLIDQLNVFVYPLTLGRGVRLIPEGGPALKFALAGSQAYANGVLHLAYGPAT